MILFFRSLVALRHLRMHLAHEGLTAAERAGYLLAWSVWITMASVTAVELTGPTKVVLYAITAWGVWWAYMKNGGAEGHALLDRYFSVGWIVTFRVTVVLLVAMSLLSFVQVLGAQLFTASETLRFFLSPSSAEDGEPVAADAFQELVMMGAELYVAWSIGRHLGKIREAAGDATGLAPVASMTSQPSSTLSGGYGGWTGRPGTTPAAPVIAAVPATTRPLDRFVERVVQSELAGQANRRGGVKNRRTGAGDPLPKKGNRRVAKTARRRSTVRLIKARATGRR